MRSRLEAFEAQLIGATKAGLSLRDACRQVGVNENTARTWLRRGRQEEAGRYREFAEAMDAARSREASAEPMTEAELIAAVWRAVRRGNVAAMRLAWELLKAAERPPKADPLSEIDELAARCPPSPCRPRPACHSMRRTSLHSLRDRKLQRALPVVA